MPDQLVITLAAIILAGCGSQAGSTKPAEPAPTPIPAALSAAPRASQAAPTIDRTNQTGTSAIAPVLIAHGTLDGDRITDFKLRSRCETDFVTANGTTTIDWSKVGNLAEHDDGNQVVTPIDDGSGPHQLAVPKDKQTPTVGDVAAVVNMGLSGIAQGCAAGG